MARRMFSPSIVSQDNFLDMPVSVRELYFQLGMNADDDGFITPKMVMRMTGASDDDLKTLVAKGFLIPFENGTVVIIHWKVNNLIRKDWYRPTRYQNEKRQLVIDKGNVLHLKSSVNEFVNIGSELDNKKQEEIPYKKGEISKIREDITKKFTINP